MSNIYRRENGGFILINKKVLDLLNQYKQHNGKYEAGGILLGCYRGHHIEVIHATPPGPNDIRKPYRFIRKCPSHAIEALKLWEQSHETITYLGEWHTHPEAMPQPSGIDHANWEKYIHMMDCIFCIQGIDDLWVGEKSKGSIHANKTKRLQ
jgi:integrative and conjugative element protein (TIGR02256 family)